MDILFSAAICAACRMLSNVIGLAKGEKPGLHNADNFHLPVQINTRLAQLKRNVSREYNNQGAS